MGNVFWGRKGPVEQSEDGAFYVHDRSKEDKEFNEIIGQEEENSDES